MSLFQGLKAGDAVLELGFFMGEGALEAAKTIQRAGNHNDLEAVSAERLHKQHELVDELAAKLAEAQAAEEAVKRAPHSWDEESKALLESRAESLRLVDEINEAATEIDGLIGTPAAVGKRGFILSESASGLLPVVPGVHFEAFRCTQRAAVHAVKRKRDKLAALEDRLAAAKAAEEEAARPESWRVLQRLHKEADALDWLALIGGGIGRVHVAGGGAVTLPGVPHCTASLPSGCVSSIAHCPVAY